MECYSAIIKKEILPLATTWMDLEDFMLSKVSQAQGEKKPAGTHVWNLKKLSKQQQRVEWWLPGAGGGVGMGGQGEMGSKGMKLQLYRMSKSGDLMCNMMTTVNNNI